VTLEEFFVGNDDFGSIGCNSEVAEDPTTWPFVDRVYFLTSGTPEEIKRWTADLQPDTNSGGLRLW